MTTLHGLPARLLVAAAIALLCLLGQPGYTHAQSNTPIAPTIPSLIPGEKWIAVRWTVPTSTGGSAITTYDTRYIRTDATDKADANWTTQENIRTASSGNLVHVIHGLTTGIEYDVQVRAANANGKGAWAATSKTTPTDASATRTSGTELPLITASSELLQHQYNNRFKGSISSGADVDYYKIIVDRHKSPGLTGYWIYTDSDFDAKGEMFDGSETSLGTFDVAGNMLPNPEDFLIFGDLPADTYYIKVSSYGSDQGSYTLTIRAFPESSSRTDANDLTVGEIATGQIAPANDVDYYKMVLSSQTDLIVRSTAWFDSKAEIQTSTGTKLEENDDGKLPQDQYQFLIRRTLDTGTYYLKIEGYDKGERGPYTVHATTAGTPGNSTATAQDLKLGHAAGGNITSSSDSDHFRIAVSEDTYVTIWNVHNEADFDADGELLDTTGQAVTEDYIHDFADVVGFGIEQLLTAGTHYLKVASGSGTGKYTVLATENFAFTRLVNKCSSISRSTGINDVLYGCQWHLKNNGQFTGGANRDINVEPVWAGGNLGTDITVAVVDDGLDHQHPDLLANVDVSKNHDYNGNDLVYDPLADHGTAVAGIIAARDNNIGMRGVAPRAKIYGYNLLNTADRFDRIDQNDTANAMSRNAVTTAVSNNSWGPPDNAIHQTSNSFWRAAIASGISTGYGGKGTFYVFPAGNGGQYGDYSNLDEYANQWGVTAVCAVNHSDERAALSEPGSNVWVCAPSSHSNKDPAIATTTVQGRHSDDFGGTSAAAPQVSGLAALLRKANPDLTWRDIKIILASSARKNDATDSGWEEAGFKYGSTTERYHFNHQYGFGVIDAKAAVDLAADWQLVPELHDSVQASGTLDLNILDATADNPGTRITSAVTLDDTVEFIEYVTLHTRFDHTSIRDLDVELVAPSGRVSKLLPYYDDSDGSDTPQATIDTYFRLGSAKHLGESAKGTWTLRVRDHHIIDTGMLKTWSITAYGHRIRPGIPTLHNLTTHAIGGLNISWTGPSDHGSSPIQSYDVRYIKSAATDKADANWTERTSIWGAGDLAHHLNGLEAQTEYDVQVRAVNSLKNSNWSGTQKATTGDNTLPTIANCDPPSLTNRQLVWHSVLTVGEKSVPGAGNQPEERVGWGYYKNVGTISGKNSPITLGDNSYTVGDMLMQFDIPPALAPLIAPPTGALVLNLSADLTTVETENLRLHICNQAFSFQDAQRPESHHSLVTPPPPNPRDIDYYWTDSGLTWTLGLSRILVLSVPDAFQTSQAAAAPPVTGPPIVQGSPSISSAGDDGQWTAGETVEVTLTFNEAVAVDTTGGRPSIGLTLGGTAERQAHHLRGEGTPTLVFSYTLTAGDSSYSTMLVPANSLALNGGTIRSRATGTDAALQHDGAAVAAATGTGTRSEPPATPPARARFDGLPENHDGAAAFTVNLHLNPVPEEMSYTTIQAALQTNSGSVTTVKRRTAEENDVWLVSITPSQGDDITIRLPALPCSDTNAICINGQPLAKAASATVPGQPFTAEFAGVTAEHDSVNPFDVELHFSHEPAEDFSYRTVKENMLDLTGGTIGRVWRLQENVSRRWGITIAPSGLHDVLIEVRETTDCAHEHAVCDVAGRILPSEFGATITGPPYLSVLDAETDTGTLTFTVTLNRPIANQVTVAYATSDGTATAGSDYNAISGTLTFTPETTTQTIPVQVTNNQDNSQGVRTLTLTLSDPSPVRVRLAHPTATGNIQ